MKRVLCVFLAAALLVCAAACSEGTTDSTSGDSGISSSQEPADEIIITSYASAYAAFNKIALALTDKINDMIDANNYALEERDSEGFYNSDGYVDIKFKTAFVSETAAFTAAFGGDVGIDTIEDRLSAFFDTCEVTEQDGSWRIDYTSPDGYGGYMTAEFDQWAEGFKFEAYSDESGTMELVGFIEFVTLDTNKYALYDMDERAIVTYEDGEITDILYSRNKLGFDEIGDTSWYNEPEAFPDGDYNNEEKIDRDRDELECFAKYDGTTLELEMRSADVQYDLLGRPKSVTWNWENCSID